MELFDVTLDGKNYKVPFVQKGNGNKLVVWSRKFNKFYPYNGDTYLTVVMEVLNPFSSLSYPKIKLVIKGHECLIQPEEISHNGIIYKLIDIYRDWMLMLEQRGLMIAKKQMKFLVLNNAVCTNEFYNLPEFKRFGEAKVIFSCNMRLGVMFEEHINQLYDIIDTFDDIGATLYQAKTPEIAYWIPGENVPCVYWDDKFCRSNVTPNIDITMSGMPCFMKEILPEKMEISVGNIEINEDYLFNCISICRNYMKDNNLSNFSIIAKLTPNFLKGQELANSKEILKDLFPDLPKHIKNAIADLS